jgi:uncharacterized tellurite resistance protein B-like protein
MGDALPPVSKDWEVRVSLLKRFLGLSAADESSGESEAIRQIAGQLEGLGSEQARYLAGFAYVLARVAHADMRMEDAERDEMQRALEGLGGLGADEAALAVEIAQREAGHLGGSENYLVTREFRRISSREQRVAVMECLYAVAAADGSISTAESSEIVQIAEELGFTRGEAIALRGAWKEHLAEIQALRRT